MKSYLRLILYQNMKKLGSPYSSQWTFYRHVFAHIYYVIHELAGAHGYLSWTDAHSVINSDKEMNMVSKCLEKCAKHDDRENLAIICWKMPERAKNACACAFEWFFVKCSIWLETYAKKIVNDLEHFKFLRARKRAHERVRVDLRTFFDLKLTGRILILFMINMNEKLLSVMKIWS